MNDSDRQAIAGLFSKLGDVERQAPPRDAGAEAFIAQRIGQQPGAPYFMAQTIVMQEYALNQAQARIQELENQAQEQQYQQPAAGGGGGLFGSLFGGGQQPARRPGQVPSMPRATGVGAGALNAGQQAPMQPQQQGGFGGGGFLAGAAQTAMGVAGGVLLGNAIGSMFAGDAPATETAAAEPAAEEPQVEEAAYDDGGFDDFGGDEI